MKEDFNKWAKYVADIERLETENAELVTKCNELEKERVQLDDQILNLQNMCEDEVKRRCELSSKTEQLEKKLKTAISKLEFIAFDMHADYDGIEFIKAADNALKQIKEVK